MPKMTSLILRTAAALLTVFALSAGGIRADTDDSPSFGGKLLQVVPHASPNSPFLLENAKIVQVGSTRFLVGKGLNPDRAADFGNRPKIWVALEYVQSIMEFDDLSDYRKQR